MSFVHLQVKSAYSLLTSSAKVEELVRRASELGYKELALTDVNVMYGIIPFYKECKKLGMKPIIGLTLSILIDENQDGEKACPLILLAKNQQGYRNLLKLSSIVQTKSKEGLPKKWLPHYCQGLIAITPGIQGEIEQFILEDKMEDARKSLSYFKRIFEENSFYCSIQNHHTDKESGLNARIRQLCREENILMVATNDVHYLEKTDSFAHECLLSIKHGTKLSDEQRHKLPTDHYYLKSISEMVEMFSDEPDLLENTITISNMCQVEIELGQRALPKYPVPNGESADKYLARICMRGLKERYHVPSDDQLERLTYELEIINKMNFSDYFLIVWDFMKYAHEQGILTGPGRGSAAGSIVAYVLEITDVDPMKHHLLFERFLNPERVSMPDIDIDFPDNRRDELISYVAKKYGQLHVAQIITYGTMAARASLRDVGRVMGISGKEADFIARQIPSRLGITLKQAYEESQTLRDYIEQSDLGKRIFYTAMKLEGLPRHTSTHAAGVVISEQPLTELIAIQDGHDGVYLTQFSMDILEEIGLLKMDFLGLRNLTLLDNIVTMIKKSTGKQLDLSAIPFNDSATYSLLSKGDTTGIFQLESAGMRNVLMRLKPTELEDIVAVNALYRPGPMENIPVYIARKHKYEQVTYPHPDLETILKPTYGVIVYQEQIIQIASKIANFSLGEADLLRRAVSKKKKDVLDREREHFVKGCMENGYESDVANLIYDLIVRFANYGFNRSHAVAYSMIAYQLAYLKANYRLYFTAALLTSVIGNDEKVAEYIREAKQNGIKILPPSINKSRYPFSVEKGNIRFSLAAIKNVGATAFREIVEVRKKKSYSDLFDFCIRTSMKQVNRRILESLVCSGAFDEFGEERATLLATIDVALEHAELVNPHNDNQIDLFDDEDFFLKPKYVEINPFTTEEKLRFEKEALGFYLSSHPVSSYSKQLADFGVVSLADLAAQTARSRIKVCGLVTNERTIRTKKGEVMAFLTLSDETGDFDAVAFPTIYKYHVKELQKGQIIIADVQTEFRDQKLQLIMKDVKTVDTFINQVKEKKQQTLFIKVEKNLQEQHIFENLKRTLKQNSGNTPVVIYYEREQKTIKLQKEYWVNPTEQCIASLNTLLGNINIVLKS